MLENSPGEPLFDVRDTGPSARFTIEPKTGPSPDPLEPFRRDMAERARESGRFHFEETDRAPTAEELRQIEIARWQELSAHNLE